MEFVNVFGVVEKPQWVGFNGVYFTIFKANVGKILIFEWILLLEIQTNCKNWVWKEKCAHIAEFRNFEFEKCEQ